VALKHQKSNQSNQPFYTIRYTRVRGGVVKIPMIYLINLMG
jgi:hypothetical protein